MKVVDEQMDGVAGDQRKKLQTIEKELADVRRRLDTIYNLVETTEVEMADFTPRIRQHRERQERLEFSADQARAALAQRRNVLDDVNTIAAYAQDMSAFLKESELTERRTFIESFVKEVIVMPDNALMRYTIPISQSTPKIAVLVGGRFECDRVRSGGSTGGRLPPVPELEGIEPVEWIPRTREPDHLWRGYLGYWNLIPGVGEAEMARLDLKDLALPPDMERDEFDRWVACSLLGSSFVSQVWNLWNEEPGRTRTVLADAWGLSRSHAERYIQTAEIWLTRFLPVP